MSKKHVILRIAPEGGHESFRGRTRPAGPTAVLPAVSAVEVEVESLELRDIPRVMRENDVVAVAPVMPMKLIAPVPMQAIAEPAAGGITWGVKAVGADTSPFSGNGVVVSVLDTGIDASHPAFAGVQIVQKDFTGEGDGDEHGHGTHCAGSIFGRTVENTRIGVAPGVKKALIGKVLGTRGGSSDQIVKAIQWAVDNGANVISMSLGIDFPGLVKELQDEGFPPELATSVALEGYRANVLLFERLASLIRAQAPMVQTALLVAAAGNESRRNVRPDFEIAVSPPAVAEGVVSVAAIGEGPQGFTIAPFSNVGAVVSGPGVGVLSARRGGGLTSMNGTSMATPHVAGVAALWAEKLKNQNQLNPVNLSTRLIAFATTEGLKTGFDPADVGSGLVRAPQE
ncbi:MAG: S8 family peptidase [Vicinamibacterales bacterium]